MVETKFILNKLSEFNKIIDDLINIEVKFDKDEILLLLSLLLKSFEHFKFAFLFIERNI
jgi:hypothetical protein